MGINAQMTAALEARSVRDGAATRRNILEVATRHFAEKGYSGARIDEIAAETATSKRMIYYYFKDKEELFVAVLEHAYGCIRHMESGLHVDELDPESALAGIVGSTFDYDNANPDFVRLVMTENIHRGRLMAQSKLIGELNVSVIAALERICERGHAAGIFRPDIDVVDLHMTISALCFFNVANRYTFSLIFGRDLASPEALAARRARVIDIVLRSVRA
jgi:AcrR family transcriptional regulator